MLAGQVKGGSIYADVISETGPEPVEKKRLGPTMYENWTLPVGLIMSKELFEWLVASWGPHPPERDGAVLGLDYELAVKTQAGFTASLITETSFPTLDAASKEVGHVTIRVQPAAIQLMAGSGKVSLYGVKQKLWRLSNFRLEIEGLDCTHVSRIESFTVRREVAQAWAETWYDWHKQFVVDGHNEEGFERDGALSFLSTDLKAELSRIELHHLGIVRLAPAEEQPMLVTAELYCEEMALVQPGGGP